MRTFLAAFAATIFLASCATPVNQNFVKRGEGIIIYSTESVPDYEDGFFDPPSRFMLDISASIRSRTTGTIYRYESRKPAPTAETVWVALSLDPGRYELEFVRESRKAGRGGTKVVKTRFGGPGARFELKAGEIVYLGQFTTRLETSIDKEYGKLYLDDAVKNYSLDADEARMALAEFYNIEGQPIRTVDPFGNDSRLRATYRLPFSERAAEP